MLQNARRDKRGSQNSHNRHNENRAGMLYLKKKYLGIAMTFTRAPASIEPIEQTMSACSFFDVVDDPLHICANSPKK